MLSALEKKRIEVEIMKVDAAKANLELTLLEREDEMTRIKNHIRIQEERLTELKDKLAKEGN